MEYSELRAAVREAQRQRDVARCFALIDGFIATATGEERGLAYVLKADKIMLLDWRKASEGILLVNDALAVLSDPHHVLLALVSGLGLCYMSGDVERAVSYETQALQLVHMHGMNPDVLRSRFRLFHNLGLIATLRREWAVGYWHFVQGVTSLLAHGSDDTTDIRRWLCMFYYQIIGVCLEMGRIPEAEDALSKAQAATYNEQDGLLLKVTESAILRSRRRFSEAYACLSEFAPDSSPTIDPLYRTRYYLERALVARDMADLQSFHAYLTRAQNEAVTHSLDFLLCQIQRVQRAPLSTEAMS